MPTMANITVKKNDGTTDVIYTQVQPAGGPGVSAIWKNQTVGTAPGQQPEMRVSSKESKQAGVQFFDVRGTYKYPRSVSNSTTGEITISEGFSASISAHINQSMLTADLNEAAAQFGNICASALIKAVLQSGRAPI